LSRLAQEAIRDLEGMRNVNIFINRDFYCICEVITVKRLFVIGLILFSFIYIVTGCSSEVEKKYIGQPLKIAVVGTIPPYEFENVEFVAIKIDDLFKSKGHFEALFVMEETFLETSQAKYAKALGPFFLVVIGQLLLPMLSLSFVNLSRAFFLAFFLL
jgi:hypothetical protein